MTVMEQVVRPFATQDVTPQAFHPAGDVGVPPVRISVGLRGGTKTFNFNGSATSSTYMMTVHKETPPQNFDMSTGKVTS